MADRGRDLKFSILSDVDKFDLDQPARDLDRFGDDARRAAQLIDRAFDSIGRSSRVVERKIDTDTGKMKHSLREVGDEAGSTAREAAASFSGSGDVGDALQELAANAPSVLGPLGLAFGTVAGIGVGLFKAKTEALKQQVSDLVDQMIADGGRLSKESVEQNLQNLASDGTLQKLKEMSTLTGEIGVSYEQMAQAAGGNRDAMAAMNEQIEAAEVAMAASARAGESYKTDKIREAVQAISDQFAEQQDIMALAEQAMNNYKDATGKAGQGAKAGAAQAKGAFDDLRDAAGKPIVQRVEFRMPTPAQIRSAQVGILRQLGTIVVPVKPGTSASKNTSSNSRYRY
ncbi:MAG: hypothetical protein IE926_05720 [Micrococcales bacterium]|nr:hypothetical protein [Micrococcales bacterium]